MAARAEVLGVDGKVVNELRRRAVGRTGEARDCQRARLIRLHLDGVGVSEIARQEPFRACGFTIGSAGSKGSRSST